MYGIYLLATNQSSHSVNPGILNVGRSSDVGINGASGHGNSVETGNTCSCDVEMPDMRDCVPNDSYFQRDTATLLLYNCQRNKVCSKYEEDRIPL